MSANLSGPFEPYVPQLLLDWPKSTAFRQIEGSLVHIDISGFTAMSERLARKGRVGAEEVSLVLNNTFTELLTIAGELGGDLLKFGGDALLLLFKDEGHAVRAVRASALMRTRLRSIGKVQTPAGRVDLKMTVGVHSGELDMFLVGTTHRELIMVGPGTTKTVEVEEGADAGEILLSPETAAQLPAGLLGEPKGPGVLLARTPAVGDYEPPIIFCTAECRGLVPAALRPAIESPTDGEHRRITVGFIKFTGIDAMLASESSDTIAERFNSLISLTQGAVEEFGVSFLSTDIDADGGKIIVAGGVPTSTGADEEGVLLALRRIAEQFSGIDLKIGVNRGPAFAGDIGASFRRTYTVIGDAVNLAARVMSKAEPGQVLATAGVLERSATQFAVEELPPFTVKGKSDPVQAWVVGPAVGRRSVTADAEPPLFGREADLARVRSRIAEDPSLAMIDVCGPAGIGKSRFVRELRASSGECSWHFCDCAQYESATPYFPFRRLLREIAGISLETEDGAAAARMLELLAERAPELAPWWPMLATVMDLPAEETPETAQIDPQFKQARLHQTVTSFIDAFIEDAGAIAIEDAQWIDDSSLELVKHLAVQAHDRRWFVTVVHRPVEEQATMAGIEQVDLMPLEAEPAMELLQHVLADIPLLEHQLRDLVDRSGGNPLFLLELAEARRTGESLPDNVESLVQARIDRLDPAPRNVLRYSSVAGMRFDRKLLADAISDVVAEVAEPSVWKSLDEFLVKTTTGEYRFRQTLFRDVAYSGLSFRTRRALHEKIGRAIEANEHDPEDAAAILGLHFLLAGQHQDAWNYSLAAGRQAAAKHANVAAARLFGRALEAARNAGVGDDEVAEVAEARGDVAELAGMLDEADQAFRQVTRLRRSEPAVRARLFRKLGLLREREGKYPQALRWFTRGLQVLADEDDSDAVNLQRAELEIAYAGVRFRQAKYAAAVDWARRAIPEAEKTNDRQAAAHAYYLHALGRQRSGQKGTGANTEQALAIYEEIGDLVGQSNVLNKLGVDAYHSGDWTAARDFYRRSKEARQKAGDSVRAAMITQNEALVMSDQGLLGEAEQLLIQAQREFRAADDQMAIGVATSNLGRIATRSGRHEEGLRLLEEAVGRLRAIGAEQFVVDAETRIAENLVVAGDLDKGEQLIEDISAKLPSSEDPRHCFLHRIRAYASLRRGKVDDAIRSLEHGIRDSREGDNQYELALQLDALAKLTEAAEPGAVRREADEVIARLGIEGVPDLPSRLTSGG
jgi:class 3 adenylate cyclase/tetratricopeptide (TPR) repeat protein